MHFTTSLSRSSEWFHRYSRTCQKTCRARNRVLQLDRIARLDRRVPLKEAAAKRGPVAKDEIARGNPEKQYAHPTLGAHFLELVFMLSPASRT